MIFQRDGHLESEAIACYVEGRLKSDEFVEANRHMADCSDCLELLAETVKGIQELQDSIRGIERGREHENGK